MILKNSKGTFASDLQKMKQKAQADGFSDRRQFEMLLEGTEFFVKYLKLRHRTNDSYSDTKSAFHDMTLQCPSEGNGCDGTDPTCMCCTKFLERHGDVWGFVENEAPKGEPPQACICTALRDLCDDEEKLDLPKIEEIRTLMVLAYETIRE